MIYWQLFLSFLQIGMFSFGGGYAALPLIQEQVVTQHGWLSRSEFTDLITISQMTPGPIAVNSATFVGIRLAGFLGALAATFGCILPSCILVTVLSYLYLKYRKMSMLQGVLETLRPAVVSMIAAAGVSILITAFWNDAVSFMSTKWDSIVIFVVSGLAGLIWGVIPAIFKAYFNTNETLFTLMLNYVAMQIVTFCIVFWENPSGSNTVGIINAATKGGWFPTIFGNAYTLNVIIVLAITLVVYVYMKYSKQGYEISVVGESQNTARYAGIDVKKVIIRTMMISGAICGIAGAVIVSGASHTISTSTAGGRGFTAIIVAWMSKFNPLAMILVSGFLVFMQQGSIQVASQFGLNENASDIITGILLFFLIGCEFFINYKLEFRKKGEK